MRALYLGEIDPGPTIAACAGSLRPEAVWVTRLDTRYPGEASVAVTLLLNHVVLEPGDALHLTAGNLHAYLGGAGIELMGPSDNVIRGGLTTKTVDIDELRRIVDLTPLAHPVMQLADPGRYPLAEAGCLLVHLAAGVPHTSTGDELAIAVDGRRSYLPPGASTPPPPTPTSSSTTPSGESHRDPRALKLTGTGASGWSCGSRRSSRRVVGVVALLVEQRRRSFSASRSALVEVGPLERRVDAVLVDELGPLDELRRPSRLRARRRRC